MARYWNLGNISYAKKWLYITSDFCKRHIQLVKNFTNNDFKSYEQTGTCYIRWDDSDKSSMYQTSRIEHIVKSLAIFSKYDPIQDDNWSEQKRDKNTWNNCLEKVDSLPSQETFDMIDPVLLMNIVKSLICDHVDGIFDNYKASVNKRINGLISLSLIYIYFPEFKKSDILKKSVEQSLIEFIKDSFYLDGGMTEASFDNNIVDVQNIKKIIKMFKFKNTTSIFLQIAYYYKKK